MNACLPCRKVKMKCRQAGDATSRCERCARKSLHCIFQEHRRGRKPGTRVSKRKAASPTLSNAQWHCPEAARLFQDSNAPVSQGIETMAASEPSSLQPSGLLNHEAMRGKFSLRHVLSTNDSDALESSSDREIVPTEDPIRLGLVNLQISKSLFQNFMDVQNPYISQLDPELHTFPYVRQKSAFLFSAILAISAKAFNPPFYEKLHDHAQHLFTDCFRHGTKSTETVQAILILTYWKEPQDTRAWTSLGYVIRMCMDLGWHRLTPYSIQTQATRTELEKREARNIERTWYVIFVYDQSMSLQTGRPSMIERDGFIESIEAWCNDPMAIPSDLLLGAFVTLRLMTSTVFKLLGSGHKGTERRTLHSVESLLTLINERIEEWGSHWLHAVETKAQAEDESCHPFLIRFYGTHIRLQLFSLPLQDVLSSTNPNISPSLEILWVSYSSAMDMLQLVSSYSSRLYFAQDSVHVMTAYSAAFLIKLLLSAPDSIVNQIESRAVNAIRNAAQVFSEQSGPPGSSCGLQAKFLDKITCKVLERRKEITNRRVNTNVGDLDHDPGRFQSHEPPATASRSSSDPSRIAPGTGNVTIPDTFCIQQENSDLLFTDDDAWANLFASAGFSTQDGIFLA